MNKKQLVLIFLVLTTQILNISAHTAQIRLAPTCVVEQVSNQQFFKILAQQRMVEQINRHRYAIPPYAPMPRQLPHASSSYHWPELQKLLSPSFQTIDQMRSHLNQQKQFITGNIGFLEQHNTFELLQTKLQVIEKKVDGLQSGTIINHEQHQQELNLSLLEKAYFSECVHHYEQCLNTYNHDRMMASLLRMNPKHLSRSDQYALLASLHNKSGNLKSEIQGLESDNTAYQQNLSDPRFQKMFKKRKWNIVQQREHEKSERNNKTIQEHQYHVDQLNEEVKRLLPELEAWKKAHSQDLEWLTIDQLQTLYNKECDNIESGRYIRLGEQAHITQARLQAHQEERDLLETILHRKETEQQTNESLQASQTRKEQRVAYLKEVILEEQKQHRDPHCVHKARVNAATETIEEDLDFHLNEELLEAEIEAYCYNHDIAFEGQRAHAGTHYQLYLDKEHRYLFKHAMDLERKAQWNTAEQYEAIKHVNQLITNITLLSASYNKGCAYQEAKLLNDVCFAWLDVTQSLTKASAWSPHQLQTYNDVFTRFALVHTKKIEEIVASKIRDRTYTGLGKLAYNFEYAITSKIESVRSSAEQTMHSILDAIDKKTDYANAQQLEDLMYAAGYVVNLEEQIVQHQKTIQATLRAPINGTTRALKDITHMGCHPLQTGKNLCSHLYNALGKIGEISTALNFASNPALATEKTLSLLQEAADTIGPLAKKIKDMSPDELYEALLEASIYSAVMGKVLQKGTGLAGKLSCATIGQLIKQLEKGEWYAVCENIAYETGSTIPQILKEVGETAQANPTIVHEAVGKIRTAIKAAENAHETIEPGSSISFKVGQPVEKVLGVTKVKIDKETYKHIFRGGFNKKRKRGTGLHVGRNNPGLIEKIINKPNKHGIYEAFWKHPQGKYLKPSTIAPDNWNYVEYMTHANEALGNIVEAFNTKTQPINFRIRGIDNLGIKWEAWIKKLNNDLAKIESIYPTYK